MVELKIKDNRVVGWLKGFAARVDCIERLAPPQVTEGGLDSDAISTQHAKVLACQDSVIRTNGKTINNLRLSAEKLNTMLLSAEAELRKDL